MSVAQILPALSRPHQQEVVAASGLVIALEAVWVEIRRRHPDVPTVIVTVGAGSIGTRPGTLRLGHYAAARWRPAQAGKGPAVAELFIGGEGLAMGAVDVLGTLLHEAAHGVAFTRGIKDTSRAGAYHNTRFKQLGEELGLQIDRHPTIGWSTTSVPTATALAYADQVEQLRAAIVHVRDAEHQARPTGGPGGGAGADADEGEAGERSALAVGADLHVWLPDAAAAAHGSDGLRGRARDLRRLQGAVHQQAMTARPLGVSKPGGRDAR